MGCRHLGRIYSAAPRAQIGFIEKQRKDAMRALIALIIVPTVIAAVIAGARLLTLLTGDVMSAATLELIIFITVIAFFSREPSRAGRAASERNAAGRA
jgi:uncharacterized membrane protein YfcA